jgi:hypothetical protein
MNLHRAGVDMWFERVVSIRKIGQRESHTFRPSLFAANQPADSGGHYFLITG